MLEVHFCLTMSVICINLIEFPKYGIAQDRRVTENSKVKFVHRPKMIKVFSTTKLLKIFIYE